MQIQATATVNPALSRRTLERFSGRIVGVDRINRYPESRNRFYGLTVRGKTETMHVLLGPNEQAKGKLLDMYIGDEIRLTGQRVFRKGMQLFRAVDIEKRA